MPSALLCLVLLAPPAESVVPPDSAPKDVAGLNALIAARLNEASRLGRLSIRQENGDEETQIFRDAGPSLTLLQYQKAGSGNPYLVQEFGPTRVRVIDVTANHAWQRDGSTSEWFEAIRKRADKEVAEDANKTVFWVSAVGAALRLPLNAEYKTERSVDGTRQVALIRPDMPDGEKAMFVYYEEKDFWPLYLWTKADGKVRALTIWWEKEPSTDEAARISDSDWDAWKDHLVPAPQSLSDGR